LKSKSRVGDAAVLKRMKKLLLHALRSNSQFSRLTLGAERAQVLAVEADFDTASVAEYEQDLVLTVQRQLLIVGT
jgi:hypothetical protein